MLFQIGSLQCCKCLTLNSYVKLNIWINLFTCFCFLLLYCIFLASFFKVKLFYCVWIRVCASD